MSEGGRYGVSVAPAVHALLKIWKAAHRDRPQSAEALTYQSVRGAVERVIANPEHANDPKYQLKREFAGICRLKLAPASRWRILYITSADLRKSIVLWVGYRKDGAPVHVPGVSVSVAPIATTPASMGEVRFRRQSSPSS